MILLDGAPPAFDYTKPLTMATSTLTTKKERYDWLTDQFLEWIRNVPLESDAVANLPRLLREYDKRKTFWQRLKELVRA